MTEFMKLSPSYDLARRYRQQQWPEDTLHRHLLALYGIPRHESLQNTEVQELINDFDRVLKTYDEFGDLAATDFDTWWDERGLAIFGYDYEVLRPTKIGQLDRDEDVRNEIAVNLERYLSTRRTRNDRPPTIFIALRLDIPKRRLLKQLSIMIDQANVPVPIKSQRTKRSLSAKRLRGKPLFKCLQVLKGRAMYPKTPLWRLGARCEISTSKKAAIPVDAKPNAMNVDQRLIMGVLTSRALRKATFIAEHAARGDFPMASARRLPIYDWDAVYECMRRSRPQLKPRTPKQPA